MHSWNCSLNCSLIKPWAVAAGLVAALIVPALPVGAESDGSAAESGSTEVPFVNVEWRWTAGTDAEAAIIDVDDPSRYTLVLMPDGTFEALADCNRSAGGYVLEGINLALIPGPTTLVACPPGSLSDLFLSRLSNVTGFTVDDVGNLVLMLGEAGGEMVFAPGEAPVETFGAPSRSPDA
jgi:heat shock protein HslJ